MDNAADLLMLTGVVRRCPDCRDEQIFVPADADDDRGAGEFCCTTCGAAILIDPAFEPVPGVTRAA